MSAAESSQAPPDVGDAAPDFSLPSSQGGEVRLSDFRGKSSVLLIFYPGDFTPICTLQLCSYTESYKAFADRGFAIMGIGTDSVDVHRKFAKEKSISFPLLSDDGGKVCRDYGVFGSIMKRPQRALIMIDRNGIIKMRHVEMTRLLYRKADAVLALLEKALS
ncbi:MAG: peroxiredoxin family protein [Candidatus Hydrogenedentota bacterium]